MAIPRDDHEFAIVAAPERAVTHSGKGTAMKAFLKKKWGNNYAGQTLTGVTKGSIPADVADFFEDDEPGPGDVVKESTAGGDPLQVVNDAIDPKAAKKVADDKADIVARASEAQSTQGKAAAIEAHEAGLSQKHAEEADAFAAKQANPKKTALSPEEKAGAEAGKGHSVK